MNAKNEAKASVAKSGYALLAGTDFSVIVNGELDGMDMNFERIKIPSGDAAVFEIPAESGDGTESVKDFSGVILHHHTLNAFYRSEYIGGSNPPDCGSFDGITGEGNPGGNCKTCPHNQFGSGDNGSKACKNRRRVYILREGEMFPLLLSLPTGSLKPFARFIKQQISNGRKLNSVVIRFSLKKATSAGGVAFSQAVFGLDRILTPEEHGVIEKMSEQIEAYCGGNRLGSDVTAAADICAGSETGECSQ